MLDVGPDRPLSTSLSDALLAADEDEYIEVSRDCWDCGWHEEQQIHVESIDTIDGDEVRRQRQLEPPTDDMDEGATE